MVLELVQLLPRFKGASLKRIRERADIPTYGRPLDPRFTDHFDFPNRTLEFPRLSIETFKRIDFSHEIRIFNAIFYGFRIFVNRVCSKCDLNRECKYMTGLLTVIRI